MKRTEQVLAGLSKKNKGQYVHFVKATKQNPKTEIWLVRANYDLNLLGEIRWYAQWRQYGFYPEDGTVFEKTCMEDIKNFTISLNKKFNDKRRKARNDLLQFM